MPVYCTPRFYSQLDKLSKSNSYSNVKEDVLDFLNNNDISELHQITPLILIPNKFSQNKYRIPSSNSNRGKSGSYRCIACCYPETEYLVLDSIYPKTGSDGADNLKKEAYKEILLNVKRSIDAKELYLIDLNLKAFIKGK